ncbi:MAG: YfiR family protein [Spirochaetia bacterium]|nr:YfiR family protein [Spirochaetia bacterium]
MKEKAIKKLFLVCIIFVNILSLRTFVYAQEVEKEYNLKAYFIYNFTKFIEWPLNDESKTFNIAIIGKSEIETPLQVIASKKTVKELKIKINILSEVKNVINYHIIFIPAKQSYKLAEIQKLLINKPALIVTEKKKMAMQGSAVNFVILNKKVRFEINHSVLKEKGFKVNSNLLKLATEIY